MPEIPAKYLTDMSRNMESMTSDIKKLDRQLASFDSLINSIREDISGENIAESITKKIAEKPSPGEIDSDRIVTDITSKINSSLDEAISKTVGNAAAKSFSAIGDKIASSLDVSIDSIMGDLKIPGLKKGGRIKKGGTAVVGEDGPEILNLPPAAEVIPLKEETKETLDPAKEPTGGPDLNDPDIIPERVKNFDEDEDDDPRRPPEWLGMTQMEQQEFQSRMFYGEEREALIAEFTKRPIGEVSDWQKRRLESLREEELMDTMLGVKTDEKSSEPVAEEGTADSLLTPEGGQDSLGTASIESEGSPEKKTADMGNLLAQDQASPEAIESDQQPSGVVEAVQKDSLEGPVVKQQETESLNENPVVSVEPIGLSPAPEQPKVEPPSPAQQQTQTTQQTGTMEQSQPPGNSQGSQSGAIESGMNESGGSSAGQPAAQPSSGSDNSELLSVMKQILNVLSGPIKVQGMSPVRPNSKFS